MKRLGFCAKRLGFPRGDLCKPPKRLHLSSKNHSYIRGCFAQRLGFCAQRLGFLHGD